MKAALFYGAGRKLGIESVPDPVPQADQVIIEVARAGICGSDLHITQTDYMPAGLILGHEFAGTVVDAGAAAKGIFKTGSRVTALPLNPCNSCEACGHGWPNLCATGHFTGTALFAQGAYAQYVAARVGLTQPLPDGVDFDLGGMVEPLAVAHHIVAQAELRKNAAVLIIGGGPIGQGTALFARHAGARHVVLSEPSPERRAKALELGATAVIDPRAEAPDAAFERLTGGAPDVVFECVGLPGMLEESVRLVRVRGVVVIGGVLLEQDRLNPIMALSKEVTIRYSQAYTASDFETVIDAIAKGKVVPAPMHTSTVTLEETPDAFENLRNAPSECKVLIAPNSA